MKTIISSNAIALSLDVDTVIADLIRRTGNKWRAAETLASGLVNDTGLAGTLSEEEADRQIEELQELQHECRCRSLEETQGHAVAARAHAEHLESKARLAADLERMRLAPPAPVEEGLPEFPTPDMEPGEIVRRLVLWAGGPTEVATSMLGHIDGGTIFGEDADEESEKMYQHVQAMGDELSRHIGEGWEWNRDEHALVVVAACRKFGYDHRRRAHHGE